MNKKDIYIYYKNKNGMGGVAKNDWHEYTISPKDELFALDTDEVTLDENHEDQSSAQITQVLTHNTIQIKGFIQKYRDKYLLRVNTPKFGHYLVIIKSELDSYDREQAYTANIISYPSLDRPYFEVELAEKNIDNENNAEIFIENLLINSKVPVEFSNAALEQSKRIPDDIPGDEIKTRNDLRHLPFVTIDGMDAKDFDDAVYAEIKDGVFHLFVAIADVANYVTLSSALDHDAFNRGTSIYFPKRVIPMLPEHLSNGLCSLNPNVDRLTMCVEMRINEAGKILDYKISNAVIKSKARLNYAQVHEWINDLSLVPGDLIENITNLYLIYQALLSARAKRGAIDFNSVEPVFKFDANGDLQALEPRVRLESHRLIEECMLAANVCVAKYFVKHDMLTLFRIHPKPSEEKFTALKTYLNSLAISLDVKYADLTPNDLADLLKSTASHPDAPIIETTVLRTMQLAIYSPNNSGHFGLSYDTYLHFTSPIRRYPDLLVHRALKQLLKNEKPEYTENLEVLGEFTSFTERRAEELSRKVDAFYKCQYASMHIGQTFKGLVSSVVSFGLFVYIPDLMIDGLIHISNLGEDYFVFNEGKQTIIGKKTATTFKPGQEVMIQIAKVDTVQQFIDLSIAEIKE